MTPFAGLRSGPAGNVYGGECRDGRRGGRWPGSAPPPESAMGYRLKPTMSVERAVQGVATERLDDAVARLDELARAGPDQISHEVHEVRKRCKEVRGLARLVRPALGPEFARFNHTVRDAARDLSSIRDAHALLETFDDLQTTAGHGGDRNLNAVRSRQVIEAAAETSAIRGGDPRILRARDRLTKARRRVGKWELPDRFETIGVGLDLTYRRGRRGLDRAQRKPTSERMHDWRKAVKTLWYQMRLLERTAPSVLTPLVARLDDLSEALGDDHDLAVLIDRLQARPERFGGRRIVERAVRLARAEQDDLRSRAFRLGATIYAESPKAFLTRIQAYWESRVLLGPELTTGGIAELVTEERRTDARARGGFVERERKFLVAEVPELAGCGTVLRQGYLAIDGKVSVRVRDAGAKGCTLTLKAGTGAERIELEWRLDPQRFEAVWELTRGRRVHKTRHSMALDGRTVELDVFADDLDGLVVAEVEFDSAEAMAGFHPPGWFGREVTDDVRYANAALAVEGLEPAFYT